MLPSGIEPLILPDGTIINPVDGTVVESSDSVLIEVPNMEEAQREIVAQRRRLIDLPVPPKQMNTMSVVLTYSLMGVSEADIAQVLGVSEDQVGRIKMSDAYLEVQSVCVKNITENDRDAVRNMFVAHSRSAAQNLLSLAKSKRQDVSLRATESILDRAGLRPADVVEHRHKVEGGLRVEYVDKREEIKVIDHADFAKEF